MDESRLKLLEEWYKGYENPSVEGHIRELVSVVRKVHEENNWLYGKLSIINGTIEETRREMPKT